MRWMIVLVSLTGCLRTTQFVCDTDADCPSGTCESSVGACSFPDSMCSSGRRFGDFAGSLSNTCVGGSTTTDGGVDGAPDGSIDAPPDAPPDAPVGCLGSYIAITGGNPNHRYKLFTTNGNWMTRRDACATEGTYLAVPDDQTELDALLVLGGAPIWVGVTDMASENMFATVLNMPATFLPWATNQPDDNNPGEDCVLASNSTGMYTDERCNGQHRAVCECLVP